MAKFKPAEGVCRLGHRTPCRTGHWPFSKERWIAAPTPLWPFIIHPLFVTPAQLPSIISSLAPPSLAAEIFVPRRIRMQTASTTRILSYSQVFSRRLHMMPRYCTVGSAVVRYPGQ